MLDLKVSILLLAALLFTSDLEVCHADIGETEARCIARYGDESDLQENLAFDVVGDKATSFQLKTPGLSLTIDAIFLNGIDARETIRNADPSLALSDQQKNAVLDSERAGFQWKKQKTTYRTDRSDVTYGTEYWVRTDGALATCWMFRKVKSQSQWNEIDFSTRDYASAQRALDRQDGTN